MFTQSSMKVFSVVTIKAESEDAVDAWVANVDFVKGKTWEYGAVAGYHISMCNQAGFTNQFACMMF